MRNALEVPRFPPLLAYVLLLAVSRPAWADAGCLDGGKPFKAITYVLVDRTDRPTDSSRLDQFMRRIAAMITNKQLAEGERLIVGTIKGRSTESQVLLDLVNPENTWTSIPREVRAQQRRLHACLNEIRGRFLRQPEEARTSPILETIHSVVLPAFASNPKVVRRLIIYSDMVQNGDRISFYGAKGQLSPDAALEKTRHEKLIPNISGTHVFVAGTGGTLAEAQARRVGEFWQQYFRQAGAQLEFYGPTVGF